MGSMAISRQRITFYLKRIIPLIIIFLVGSSLVYDRSLVGGHQTLNNLPELTLAGVRELLVVAPHPDDESLGPGGLIQAALAQGIHVEVVVATNGDGEEIAPAALGMGVIPKTADFIAIGKARQQESMAALQIIGVPREDINFLSYPDRGTKPMWMADWNTQCPYYSSYTKSTSSPYPLTYDRQASYCGKDILHDLQSIISSQKPDLIILPHPDDQHPDHLAISNFTRMAAALELQSNAAYHPKLFGYLVHYGYYPAWRGFYPDKPLLPPLPLTGVNYSWQVALLSQKQEATKMTAISSYSSQIKMMKNFLVSFDRLNELFMPVSLPVLSAQATSGLPAPYLTGGGKDYLEPGRETSRLLVAPGADIIGWQIERQGDKVSITVIMNGKLIDGIKYTIYLKTRDGQTQKYQLSDQKEAQASASFTISISLAELNYPSLVSFSAETRQDVLLDASAWEFILLDYPPLAQATPVPQ
ncbi:MAG: hypothetical protein C3F13_13910 [Anaerolineales bacterium]|nr:PIG-L family deacetylase [Anaerolineae bacterium]PWB51527.1 MAG: hypothetical protein C3F13_13910 [Anaerolineales bacterium]